MFEVTTGSSVEDPSLFGKDQPKIRKIMKESILELSFEMYEELK